LVALLDLAALKTAEVHAQPFEHLLAHHVIRPESLAAIDADFPEIETPGSLPPEDLQFGPVFKALLAELQTEPFRDAVAQALGIDLSRRPTTLTVRGRAKAEDGRIHTDSTTKLVTVLLYLNSDWAEKGGLLRLLRSPDNLDDYFLEVPPEAGVLLAFRCRPNAWHGHKPFAGVRRVIQLNWVTSEAVVRRERFRHRLSARFKRLKWALSRV
jgi:hypothetical protein